MQPPSDSSVNSLQPWSDFFRHRFVTSAAFQQSKGGRKVTWPDRLRSHPKTSDMYLTTYKKKTKNPKQAETKLNRGEKSNLCQFCLQCGQMVLWATTKLLLRRGVHRTCCVKAAVNMNDCQDQKFSSRATNLNNVIQSKIQWFKKNVNAAKFIVFIALK